MKKLSQLSRTQCIARSWHFAAAKLCAILFVGNAFAQDSPLFYVDGDPIGADSSTTDNTGGFTAVKELDTNIGQPAILVSLSGQELLTEFRVVAFGLATFDGHLLFDQFVYHLDVWKSSDYFAGSAPQFQVELVQPSNVNLVATGATMVVPDTPFGEAGVAGANAPTYDLRFDLTQLPITSPLQDPFAMGDWVFGFQSQHIAIDNGYLRVSGSVAEEGPLPLFSRDNFIPRGILGGQDPEDINLYWGMSLTAAPVASLGGDFNGDGMVDAADYPVWRHNLGAPNESSLNNAGDGLNGVDIGDYLLWKQNFGISGIAATVNDPLVPEPVSAILILSACGGLALLRKARRTGQSLN